MQPFLSSLSRIRVQVRKELLALFETPVAYIVTILFLGISEFLFFGNVFVVGEASLVLYYNFLPWILLFVVPALTMGVLAQERESGTYETLATHPVSERELVVAKWFGVVLYLAGALLAAVIFMAGSFSFFASIDWGMVVGGYVAGVSIIGVFAAVGVTISSLFTKQVSSLLTSIAVLFFLILAGTDFIAGAVPVTLTLFFERVSVLAHFQGMSRGVIDLRDAWYFVSVVVACLALTEYRLVSLRYGALHRTRMSRRTIVALVVVTVLVSNVLGSAIPGRIDLTADQLYTLSPATTRFVNDLPDMVTITLYASEALPAQLQPTVRDVRDMLKDYVRYGKGKVTVVYKDPSISEEAAQEAVQAGVQTVQFNVMGQDELSVKQGYLGLTVAFHGEQRSIPFIERTNDLEYQITSMLAELTVTDKKQVAFLGGHGELSRFGEYSSLSGELAKLYTVTDLMLDEKTAATARATSTDVIVIADPDATLGTSTRRYLSRFVADGGAVLALVNGVKTEPQTLSAYPSESDVGAWLATLGIQLGTDIVYDLRSNETLPFNGVGGMVYLLPYPFWARSALIEGSPITAHIESVMMPWASTVSVDEGVLAERGATSTPLIGTSPYAGRMEDSFDITPDQELPTDDLTTRVLAYAIAPNAATGSRMVVVGSGKFLTDDAVARNAGNLAFGLSAVSWLAQDESLASIKVKSGQRRVFVFENSAQQALVAYGNMGVAVLLPIVLGSMFLMRRRRKSKETYTSHPIV